MNRHLNNDQLLHRMYGLSDGDSRLHPEGLHLEGLHPEDLHLEECPECAARLAAMELRRADSAAEASEARERIPSDLLARQRRAIYARMEQPTPARVHWAPALAAATLLAVGLFVYHPSHRTPHVAPAPVTRPELSEEQLFSDVFSMEQAAEPRAAAPIRALFEDHQVAEEQ